MKCSALIPPVDKASGIRVAAQPDVDHVEPFFFLSNGLQTFQSDLNKNNLESAICSSSESRHGSMTKN